MFHLHKFLTRQGKFVLDNNRYALLYALLLALFPYTTWLSLSVISLITLRKGWREGALLTMPVSTAYFGVLLVHEPTMIAVINTLLTFLPCYLAACTLALTISWRSVACLFFVLLGMCALVLQWTMPEFVVMQFQYLSTALSQAYPDWFASVLHESNEMKQLSLANYFFGVQLVSVFLSSLFPLLVARSMQAQLYNPGGFHEEMLTLRAPKVGLLVLGILLIAANQHQWLAMNLLPLLLFCFLLAGLSISVQVLKEKKIRGRILMLLIPLIALPFVMLPVYVILGSLDSLFNLRLYLPSNAGKTT